MTILKYASSTPRRTRAPPYSSPAVFEPRRTRAFGCVLELDSASVSVAAWQGKLEEAIELYKKAIIIGEQTLGKEHPKLAIRYNNLAGVYQAQVL